MIREREQQDAPGEVPVLQDVFHLLTALLVGGEESLALIHLHLGVHTPKNRNRKKTKSTLRFVSESGALWDGRPLVSALGSINSEHVQPVQTGQCRWCWGEGGGAHRRLLLDWLGFPGSFLGRVGFFSRR